MRYFLIVQAGHLLTVTPRQEGQVELSGGRRLNNLARRDVVAPGDSVNTNSLQERVDKMTYAELSRRLGLRASTPHRRRAALVQDLLAGKHEILRQGIV
jgi:hypothetical protein